MPAFHGSPFVPPAEDRIRSAPRLPCRGWVCLHGDADDEITKLRLRDMSVTGAFLEGPLSLEVGERRLCTFVPRPGERVTLQVEVVRVSLGHRLRGRTGLGVVFVGPVDADRHRLLTALADRDPAVPALRRIRVPLSAISL